MMLILPAIATLLILTSFSGFPASAASSDSEPASWLRPDSTTPSELTAFGGVWNAQSIPLARYSMAGIKDPVRNRLVIFGGTATNGQVGRNDTWVLSLNSSPQWVQLDPAGVPPPVRVEPTGIYDPVRDRLIIFGGTTGGGGSDAMNDVWALSFGSSPVWTELAPAGTPPPARHGHTAIYDPAADAMMVFGGRAGTLLNDVWTLSLAGTPTWTQIIPTGPLPVPRAYHASAYDAARNRMIILGGWPGVDILHDVWALSLSGKPAWTQLLPSGTPPIAMYRNTAIYDVPGDRVILFGGYHGDPYNETWALPMSGVPAWSKLSTTGAIPAPRADHVSLFDPDTREMLVFGGAPGGNANNGSWRLSLATLGWSHIVKQSPFPQLFCASVYDAARDRLVTVGIHGFVFDFINDVQSLSLAGYPEWSVLATAGARPDYRQGYTATADPLRDRVLLFGGAYGPYRNDVWSLHLGSDPATWSNLNPSGTLPAARSEHTTIYDPVRDRLIVFGGTDGTYRNDVWALSLSPTPSWLPITPLGTPPAARYGHAAIYDPVRDRMVVFGGWDGNASGGDLNDCWALSLSGTPTWTQLTPTGAPPSARSRHRAIYEPLRDRMVVFGGWNGSASMNDTWALALAGTPSWTHLIPSTPTGSIPLPRHSASLAYDPERDQMILFSGYQLMNDTWFLNWDDVSGVPDSNPRVSMIQMRQNYPNPFNPVTTIEFQLANTGPAELSVYNIRGERVRRLVEQQTLEAGLHSTIWDGVDDAGRSLPSGAYYCRLVSSGRVETRKVVLSK